MIQFTEISVTDIDIIKPLWEKLREHQSSKSVNFGDDLKSVTWERRKNELTGANKRLKIFIATKDDKHIGYCISSITNEGKGEIDSLFIDDNYRKKGMGSEFMERALQWFDENGIKDIYISVFVGNEEVLGFYGKFGFAPRSIYLKRQISVEKGN